jgi:hypothetical protein
MIRRVTLVLLAAALPLATAGAQVRFERTGYRLTAIGERIAVSARVATGRAASAIRWRVADPSIATVTPQGVVQSQKVGYTRLWAVAGDDSASALILVDQWAAKYDFFPSVVRLDAVGARAPLRIQVRDAQGHPVADAMRRGTSCRSLNERIATLASNGQVSAIANGATYIRCTDRGIADSVRVEVRQRAAAVTIVDKLGFSNKVVGDTFRIRLSAKDVSGGDIRDVQATWASLNPTIVSVDPQTGFSRTVSAGNVRVVAQVGDVTDTVSIQVLPGSGMGAVAMITDSLGGLPGFLEARAPSLYLQSLFLTVGDTARVTPRDATGAAIANAEFRMTSNDTAFVHTLGGQRVVARKAGNTHVVVQFGGVRDSLLVSVRDKADADAMAAEAASAVVFVRPSFNLDSARARNRAQLDSASRAIQRQSVVAQYNGRLVAASVIVAHAAHATRDTNFLDKSSGILYGAAAEVAPHRRIRFAANFRTGQLSPTGSSGEDLTVTEIEGDVTFQPAPWFGLRAGYVRRVTKTELASQRWEFPRATAVTRFGFVGGAITTVTGISLLPGARYSGYLDAQNRPINPDPFSLAGEAGLEAHSGSFTAALLYYAERFTFPRVNNNATARTDQFSALRLRIGFQLGR